MNVYDFDNTIYAGNSTIDFWKFCLRRYPKKIAPASLAAVTGFVLYLFGAISQTKFKEKFYKFLKHVPHIEQELDDFWDQHKHKIRPWYLAQKKPDDVIISASPEFLLQPICDKLKVRLIASLVEKHSGVHVGKNCYGKEKIKRLRVKHSHLKINKFYSDSWSDNPLALAATKKYIVHGNTITPWDKQKTSTIDKIKTALGNRNCKEPS